MRASTLFFGHPLRIFAHRARSPLRLDPGREQSLRSEARSSASKGQPDRISVHWLRIPAQPLRGAVRPFRGADDRMRGADRSLRGPEQNLWRAIERERLPVCSLSGPNEPDLRANERLSGANERKPGAIARLRGRVLRPPGRGRRFTLRGATRFAEAGPGCGLPARELPSGVAVRRWIGWRGGENRQL